MDTEPDADAVANQYISVLGAAEDFVHFAQPLGEERNCEVVERLIAPAQASDNLLAVPNYDELGTGIPDASFINGLFPSLWEAF
ncbi:hypothetical protein DL764_001476 [Monosporascus ibericus]|uniref:Uncharacterized protein n=1 Tax=Monosporascus ibericus TaxID=155417 RepID=A0A4V1XCA9_9PEZI|nr:hypothetical protein DL764_001476 [Monosporascus ibericus]